MPSTDSTPPAGRPTPSPRHRAGLPMLIALLSVAALAAGILTRMIPGLPTRQPGGERERLVEEVIVDEYAIQAEAKALEHVVLQLELPRECPWPDCMVPWGHVPVFTRFDDVGDEETVVAWATAGSLAPVYRCQSDVFYGNGEPSTPLVNAALMERLTASMAPLAPGSPCPAARGCADAEAILRVRQDGRLETYVVDDTTPPEARAAAYAIVDVLRRWQPPIEFGGLESCRITSNYLETIWDVTHTAADSPPATDLLPHVDMEMFDWEGGGPPRMVDHGRGGQLVHTGSYGWTDADGSPRSAAATASAQQGGWEFWEVMAYQPTGHWTVPMVRDPVTFEMTLEPPMKLAIVPWIYKGREVEDEYDVETYAEALANAAAARANAYATADALLHVAALDATATADPVSHGDNGLNKWSAPPTPTAFPVAAGVQWSIDGLPTLPTARGIQTWMHWFRYHEDRAALTRLREAGFEWFKQRFAWADMQPTGSQGMDTTHSDLYIQTVNDLGGRVMIQLAVPPAWAVDAGSDDPFNLVVWGRFVSAFASRYRGQVDAYEIMNEPNLAREWGGAPDPAAYARVLKVAYDAIKAADSNAVVISAGLAPTGDRMPEAMGDDTFLGALIESMDGSIDGFDGYLDAIGVHAAGFKAAPDVSPDEAAASPELGGDRTFTFRRIEDLRSLMMARSRAYAPMVITEFGWTVDPRPDSPYHWAAVDPIERGKFIATVFEQNTALFENDMWLGGPMILFSAADRAWTADDEAFWWAVADADGNVDAAVRESLGLDIPSEGEDD